MTQTSTRETAPVFFGSQPIARVTFEEFLNWPGASNHVELVDGYVVEKDEIAEEGDLTFRSQVLARLTYDEFRDWPGENPHVEWVEGYVVEMSTVTNEHDELSGFLYRGAYDFAQLKGLGIVRRDPFNMKLVAGLPGRCPDVLFVANANLTRLQYNYLDGPADLVIEVISPGSMKIDTQEKFREYEAGGVPEYWHFDPIKMEAKFFLLDANGKYQPVLPDADGIVRSTTIEGFWIKTEWLWRNPKPSVIEVLKAWGLL